MLLGSHHKLVARTKDFIHLWHTLCTISHGTDSLNTTCLENLADSGYFGGHEDGWVYLTFCVRRGTENYLLATSYLGWCGKHQYGREKRSCTSWYIETHLLYGDTFLPALHTRAGFHLASFKLLTFMESGNVMMGELQCMFKLSRHHVFCFVHLSLGYRQTVEMGMVEFLFIALHGFIAMISYVFQNSLNSRIELRYIEVRTLNEFLPFFLCRILYYLHSYLSFIYSSFANSEVKGVKGVIAPYGR